MVFFQACIDIVRETYFDLGAAQSAYTSIAVLYMLLVICLTVVDPLLLCGNAPFIINASSCECYTTISADVKLVETRERDATTIKRPCFH